MAAGPVDEEAKEGDEAGEGEEEAVAEFYEVLLAEAELKARDGARGGVELGVAVDRPVDGVEEDALVAGDADAVVGGEIGVAEDDQAAAAHGEGDVFRRGDALGGDDDAEVAGAGLVG